MSAEDHTSLRIERIMYLPSHYTGLIYERSLATTTGSRRKADYSDAAT